MFLNYSLPSMVGVKRPRAVLRQYIVMYKGKGQQQLGDISHEQTHAVCYHYSAFRQGQAAHRLQDISNITIFIPIPPTTTIFSRYTTFFFLQYIQYSFMSTLRDL